MSQENVLLARQPIYNAKKEVVAYELLFRPETEFDMPEFDGHKATSRVLLNAFTESDIASITGGLPAFVNFTEELIHSPPPFNAKHLVIEVLEDTLITDHLVSSLKKLKQKGYKIALDDFVMDKKYAPLLELADIIKLELPQMDGAILDSTIAQLKPYPAQLLAEKIETPEDYQRCLELGCTLFQGYFLSKPEIVRGKKMPSDKLVVLKLLSELQNPAIDVKKLNEIISHDPSLSFKLLKLVNSAAFRRNQPIESIHMAIMMLGISRVKSWASMLALSNLENKPLALRHISLVRARQCELLAEHLEPEQKDTYFTIGMLSCLDAYFDLPLQEILQKINLQGTIRDALTHYKGRPGLALHTVKHYDSSHWHDIHWGLLAKIGIDSVEINKMFIEAIIWANAHNDA
ncbi:MAG: HDOD domain-containing protein [Hahellaceae bacterium]|nr:HDOD domain-containing protein [Hahellaceae bacterium]